MRKKLGVISVLLLVAPVLSSQAANVAVDCTKKASVNTALGKLDRSVANTVTINGTCIEDVVVDGHRDLSIVGGAGAGLRATVLTDPETATRTVSVRGNSRVTLQSLAITGGSDGVYCDDRSTCILKNVVIEGGLFGGLALQKQSTADVVNGSITGSGGTGIGVYGASSVNVSSEVAASPVQISNHGGSGIVAQDGSFVRVDGATISGNFTGVQGERGAVMKLLTTSITGNTRDGVVVRASTLQINGSVTGNGDNGILVRKLGYVVFLASRDQSGANIPVVVTGNNLRPKGENEPASLSLSCENVTSTAQNFNPPSATIDTKNCPNNTF